MYQRYLNVTVFAAGIIFETFPARKHMTMSQDLAHGLIGKPPPLKAPP